MAQMPSQIKESVKKYLAKPRKKSELQKDSALWSYLEEKFTLAREIRMPFQRQWLINVAFLAGHQWVFYSVEMEGLQNLAIYESRHFQTDNQILPRARGAIADFISLKPRAEVLPNSEQEEDIVAARLGTHLLENFMRRNEMIAEMQKMGTWLVTTGNVYAEDEWDPRLGPTTFNEESGRLEYLGDAKFSVWAPVEILVPWVGAGNQEIHKFPWIGRERVYPLEYIQKTWKRGQHVKAEQMPNFAVDFVGIFGKQGGDAMMKVPSAVVKIMEQQPCSEFPQGQRLVMANGILLEKDTYRRAHYHLEHFVDQWIPYQFFGKGTVEQAIPLQKRWNVLTTSVNEFNRKQAKGKWLVPGQSQLQADPNDQHGEVLNYKPYLGHKPEHVQIKGLPQSIVLEYEMLQYSFDNLFSRHEVSRGTNKSDIRSGDMLEILREQDLKGEIPRVSIFEHKMERILRRVLKRMQDGYKAERILKVVGTEDKFEVMKFKGADLRDNDDVKVRIQSSLPDSKAARRRVVNEQYKAGLYGDPADPEIRRHVLNMLDDAVVTDIYGDVKQDERVARYENSLLKQGQQVPINSYDNHRVHLAEHKRCMKALDIQRMKLEDPQRYGILLLRHMQHMEGHQTFVEQEINRQMQLMGDPEWKKRKVKRRKPSSQKRS